MINAFIFKYFINSLTQRKKGRFYRKACRAGAKSFRKPQVQILTSCSKGSL
jgi:hypothetical protein